MFDIGWSEMMVIGIVALVFVGPKDLPKMFRTVGEFTGKAKGMAREFQRAMEAAAKESGVDDMKRDFQRTMSRQDFKDAAGFDEIDEQFRSIGRTVNDIRKPSNLVKKAVLGDGKTADDTADTRNAADDLAERNAEISAVEAERIKRAKHAAEARRQAAEIRARREAAEAEAESEAEAKAWSPKARAAEPAAPAGPDAAAPASTEDPAR